MPGSRRIASPRSAARAERSIIADIVAGAGCLLLATAPAWAEDGLARAPGRSRVPFGERFAPYEPMYFALEPGALTAQRSSNAKFQLSFAYRLLEAGPALDAEGRLADGLYMSYTQTSFWDLASDSKPFYDTSYRPEVWWHQTLVPEAEGYALGVAFGYAHESNGKSGDQSRSMDRLFIRPIGEARVGDGWLLGAKPRFFLYLESSDSNNDDIERYRGYADLEGSVERIAGFKLSVLGRIGSNGRHGAVQTELSYPLARLTGGRLAGYLYAQSFVGYSETFLSYEWQSEQPRLLFGYALIR